MENLNILTKDILENTSRETEWVEFKENHASPEKIGEYISAISNSACLHEKTEGYIIFGIKDESLDVVGTTYSLKKEKIGNEDLELWVQKLLNPKIHFVINEFEYEGKRLLLFIIPAAVNGPVFFHGKSYIRIGSNKRPLRDYRDKEAIIWAKQKDFSSDIAIRDLTPSEVLESLDYEAYFKLAELVIPREEGDIIEKLQEKKFIEKRRGLYVVTNLGAILLARDIRKINHLSGKSVRVTKYTSTNSLSIEWDRTGFKGYASGFTSLVKYILDNSPKEEQIIGSVRKNIAYPEIVIREFLANALVHQDFTLNGTRVWVKIFSDRIEISNPGESLSPKNRLIDASRSRNEKLADSLRVMKLCEKRGSGIDRAFREISVKKMPAPSFESRDNEFTVIVYLYKDLSKYTKLEKRSVCENQCLVNFFIDNSPMGNSSLSERLGIQKGNSATTSRVIKDAVEAGLIKLFDPEEKSTKNYKYIPSWVNIEN